MTRTKGAAWVLVGLGLFLLSFTPSPAPGAEDPDLAGLRSLLEERRFDEAIEKGREVAAHAESSDPPDTALLARTYDIMVEAFWRGSRASEPGSRSLADRAVDLKKLLHGEDHPEVATSLFQRGKLLWRLGDYAGAAADFAACVRIHEAAHGPDSMEVAKALDNQADVTARQGLHDEAKAISQRALSIIESVRGPESPELADTLNDYAGLLWRMGDFAGARAGFERSLRIKESQPEPDAVKMAVTLISMGVLLRSTKDLEESAARLRRGIDLATQEMGGDDPLVATGLENLASTYNGQGHPEEALPLLQRTLEIRESKLGPDHPHVGVTLHNLAGTYEKLGQMDKALLYVERSGAQYEKRLGSDHPRVGRNLRRAGHIREDLGQVKEARELYERAYGVLRAKLGETHVDTWATLLDLTSVILRSGERELALENLLRASDAQHRMLTETIAYMPEREALLFSAEHPGPRALLFRGLLSSDAEDRAAWMEAAWTWTARNRGAVQEELAGRNRRALQGESPEAMKAWEAVASARRELGEVWAGGPGEDVEAFEEALREARRRKEERETELARISTAFRERRRLDEIHLADLRGSLPEASVLVEIVRTPIALAARVARDDKVPQPRDIALILRAGGSGTFVDLGPSDALDDLAGRWRRSLDGALAAIATGKKQAPELAAVTAAGEELRKRMWDPIRPHLEGAEMVFLVPDGAFHLVDLAALPVGGDRYLIEESYSVHLLDSARDLVRHADRRSTESGLGEGVLALANPDFEATGQVRTASLGGAASPDAFRGKLAGCGNLKGTGWGELPESLRELAGIRKQIGDGEPVIALTGAAASEARFKSEAPGKRILHFATHGFFLNEQCRSEETVENPLLLSGLVLAGANRIGETGSAGAPEDGILTAEELAALDLRGVSMAVLSACDTGRGAVAVGEGVFGLRRAFAIAGVDTVVMSLWQVPDRQTRRWMTSFYRLLREGEPVARAVSRATKGALEHLRKRRSPTHPYHWAGFVAAGAWR